MLRFIHDYGLSNYDANILVYSKEDANFAEECMKSYLPKDKKPLVNWFIGPLLSEANARHCPISDLKVSLDSLLELVNFVEKQEISNLD
jgi:aspartyl-tRNA(Asn)/glutamyl-tRNA(Gln) amidotransferase subunit B